jgi:hypothetical protein
MVWTQFVQSIYVEEGRSIYNVCWFAMRRTNCQVINFGPGQADLFGPVCV